MHTFLKRFQAHVSLMQEEFDKTHLNREGIGNLLTAFEANTLLCYGDAQTTRVNTVHQG